MYARETWIGYAADADAIDAAGQYVKDVSEFDGGAASRLGIDQESDKFIYRPATTGDDIMKRTGTLDGANGYLYQVGSAYSDKTTTAYEFTGLLPERINQAIQQGQKMQVSRTTRALITIPDFDMESAGTSNWSTSNITFTKDTSAGNVFSGTQSGKLVATGANGWIRTTTLRVQPNKSYRVGIRARADVGTVSLGIFDVSGSALLSDSVSTTSEGFVVLWVPFTTGPNTEEVKVSIGLSGASDIAYVDTGFGIYWPELSSIDLPSDMNESYRLRLLRPTEHRMSVTPSAGNGQAWDAYSRRYTGDWEKPDYDVQIYDRDIRPNVLILQRDLPDCPMEMLVERDLWETEPLDTEAAITNAPIDTVVIHSIYCLLLDITDTNESPRWARKLAEYKLLVGVRDVARVPQSRVMEHPYYASSARGGARSGYSTGYPSGTSGWS